MATTYSKRTFRLWLEDFQIPAPLNAVATNIVPDKTLSVEIKKSLKQSLQTLADEHDISVKSLLVAAWGLLLHRFSGVAQIEFQSVKEDKTLTLYSEIDSLISLLLYCQRINKRLRAKEPPPLELSPYVISFDPVTIKRNDTYAILEVDADKLTQLFLHYSSHKFTKKSGKSIIEHYVKVLQEMTRNFNQLTTTFSILLPDEEIKLLSKWAAPQRPFAKTPNIHQLISKRAKRQPKSLAVQCEDVKLSYEEVEMYANQLSHWLINEGAEPGDKIAVVMDRTPNVILAMLAVFKTGTTYVPINLQFTDDKIHYILNDSSPKLILTDKSERIPIDLQYKTLHFPKLNSLRIFKKHAPKISITAEHIAYLIYTVLPSGRTVGAMIKHISLLNLIQWYKATFKLSDKDRSSQFSTQGVDIFFCETLPFLVHGGSIHIIDDNSKLIPDLFMQWLQEQKITICDLPTAYAQNLYAEPWPASLKILKLGSERVTRLPSKPLHFDIWNMYGTIETTVENTAYKIYEANSTPASKVDDNTPPPIGKPLPNTVIYVLDEHMQPVPIGIGGQAFIGGVPLASGYLHREEINKQMFVPDPFHEGKLLFKTGDLVRWQFDGNLDYIGKLGQQLQINGFHIGLNELENAFSQYPDVCEALVVLKSTGNNEQRIVTYLVPDLSKIRIPYQATCKVTLDENLSFDFITDDISQEGVALKGLQITLPHAQNVQITLVPPGAHSGYTFSGQVAWQYEDRCGINFMLSTHDKAILLSALKNYLTTNNLMDVLQNVSSKRNLLSALKHKFPSYMIPTIIQIVPTLPLTFNGKIDWKALPHLTSQTNLPTPEAEAQPVTYTERKLALIWKKILNLKNLSIHKSFFDLGGDSITLTEMMLKVYEQFHILLPTNVLMDLPYLTVMAEYIESHGSRYTHRSIIQTEIQQDLFLPEYISPTRKTSAQPNILITDASNFIGVYLLRDLLKKTNQMIYCFVPVKKSAGSPGQAAGRQGGGDAKEQLANSLLRFGLSNQVDLNSRRLTIIAADITAHQLGLSVELYEHLANQISFIFHCAQKINLTAAYPQLRNVNVKGTLEIIKFATQKVDKNIYFISSLLATEAGSLGKIAEDFPSRREAPGLKGGYAVSKWIAERLLTEIKNRGLPVTIFRLGHVLGDSETGLVEPNNAFLMLFKSFMQLGCAPAWEERMTFLPINFISEAIVTLALLNGSYRNRVYHLDDPHGIMFADLINWVAQHGYKIKLCDPSVWRKKLKYITPINALFSLLPLYLDTHFIPVFFQVGLENTVRTLSHAGISYPRIDPALLQIYWDYLQQVGWIEPSHHISL